MVTRKMLLAFGVLALGTGLSLMASRVGAAPACGHHPCADAVAGAGLSGKARAQCFKIAVAACQASQAAGGCTCADPGCFSCNTGSTPCACASPSGAFID